MINKREAINFLIEECYKKFPELMKEISEEEMRDILEKNISVIINGGENEAWGGSYNSESKKIKIYNRGNISLEDIKNNKDLISILAHEGIHALFRKAKNRSRSKRYCWANKY